MKRCRASARRRSRTRPSSASTAGADLMPGHARRSLTPPPKKKTSLGTWLVFAFIVTGVIGVMVGVITSPAPPPAAAARPTAQAPAAAPPTRPPPPADRLALISMTNEIAPGGECENVQGRGRAHRVGRR